MKKFSHGCTLDCFDCCKFNVYIDKNKVIKIEGDKEHPYTRGIICKKGRAHAERLVHEDRLYTPLLKVDGQWKEISFEEAIKIMGDKLIQYRDMYTSKSILHHDQYGSGSILKYIGDTFFKFYGGVSRHKGGPCWSAGMKAQAYDYGDVRGHSLEDMLNSKSIFVWGKNPANTTIHMLQILKQAKNKGIKIVVIDPIQTDTAKLADLFIQINPGTDGALSFAMTKIIINKNLQDFEFINSYVYGFDKYKEYIDSLDLQELVEECGVSEEIIEELVDLYTEKYSSIHVGYGMQKYNNGGNNVRAIDALGAITGQIGYSGGGVNYANRVYPDILNLDPYGSSNYGQDREFYVSDMINFIKTSGSDESNPPIKMAVITKSNLLNQLPGLEELEPTFSSIEFKVCFDMFMTDTSQKCDLFIPCTNSLESEDMVYSSMANPYIIFNEKVVEPKHKLMDEYEFFMELAKYMKLDGYPYVSKAKYLEKVVEPLKEYDSTVSIEKIRDTHFTVHKPVAWDNKVFATKTNKYELYSKEAEIDGLSPMPQYIKSNKVDKFRLITTHDRNSLFSQHYMDKKGISQAYINEKMAININIGNKEVVSLKSKHSKIDVEINIDNSIGDNIIKMYVGWWKKHGNPNYVIEGGISDMGGQITYHEAFVDIIKQN